MPRKLILDCDPGHDDAIAILLAHGCPDVELVAITTVSGNQSLDKTTANALRICELAGIDVPVAAGCAGPLVGEAVHAPHIHGASGMDGPVLPEPSRAPVDEHAVDLIVRELRAAPGEIALVPVGPLTNIAQALRRGPDVAAAIDEIVLMGGTAARGNYQPLAEFNIWADPEAAAEVFAAGVPLTMLGLDLTHQALATDEVVARISGLGTRVGEVVVELMTFFAGSYRSTFGFGAPPVHDPCAVARLARPELVEVRETFVAIETRGEWTRGATVVDWHGRLERPPNARVATTLDAPGFWDLVVDALAHRMSAPAFGEALRFWLRLGCISFGGPAGQIALMHEEVVERRRWISEGRFLHALGYCMALPGPEAQQLATYIGYRLHGLRGGLASGGLFVAPGFVVIVALSAIYVDYGDVAEVAAAIDGLAAAVVALVALAIVRIGRRSLRSPAAYALAVASLAALLVGVPFPLILAAGALAGVALGRRGLLAPVREVEEAAADAREDAPLEGSFRRHLAVGLAIWLVPLALTIAAGGVYFDLAWFFTVAALVTFGGAYAVLPFVAGAAVDRFDWLSAEDMVAGLALGETTPGPLIMVNVFVGYVAAYSADGGSHAAGLAGAAIVTYATFAPSFLFIFLGAPLIDRAPRTGMLAEALAGVSAAVVGAIAALALFIGDTVLLPDGDPDWFALALALAAAAALLRKADVLIVIALCAAAGLLRELA